jgi:hypothetical protein
MKLKGGPRISLKLHDCLKEEPKSIICSDHRTISLFTHTAKIVVGVFIRNERKIKDALGEGQFGFRRGKVTGDASGMLGIILERTLDLDTELCACFKDWQKPL